MTIPCRWIPNLKNNQLKKAKIDDDEDITGTKSILFSQRIRMLIHDAVVSWTTTTTTWTSSRDHLPASSESTNSAPLPPDCTSSSLAFHCHTTPFWRRVLKMSAWLPHPRPSERFSCPTADQKSPAPSNWEDGEKDAKEIRITNSNESASKQQSVNDVSINNQIPGCCATNVSLTFTHSSQIQQTIPFCTSTPHPRTGVQLVTHHPVLLVSLMFYYGKRWCIRVRNMMILLPSSWKNSDWQKIRLRISCRQVFFENRTATNTLIRSLHSVITYTERKSIHSVCM